MKKQLVLAAMAVLTLASCSKTTLIDKVNVKDEGLISFRTFSTKATETATSDLDEMQVYALYSDKSEYFHARFYDEDGGNVEFISNPMYPWPGSKELTFDAYAPIPDADKDNDNTNDTYKVDGRVLSFVPNTSIKDQKDLIVGTTTGTQASSHDGVSSLVLNHALAQIRIAAKMSAGNYTIKVKNAKIVNAAAGKSYSFADSEWTNDGVATYSTSTVSTAVTLTATPQEILGKTSAAVEGVAMIAPQTVSVWNPATAPKNTSACYLSLEIQIMQNGTKIFPASDDEFGYNAIPFPATPAEWEAGKAYNYVLDFKNGAGYYTPDYSVEDLQGQPILGRGIFFTNVQITGWDEQANTDVNLQD